MCGIVQPVGQVQWAERLMQAPKRAMLGCFLLYFVKTCNDAPSNVSCSKHVTTSYVIIKTNDVTLFYDVVTSLTVHVQWVM